MEHDRLTLIQLGQMFSHHLARSGIASFTTEELGALQTFYEKYSQVRSWQVLRAFEQAAGSGLAQTLWQLQSLLEDLGNSSRPPAAPQSER